MFWIIATVLILLALAFILPALFRGPAINTDARREQNVLIAKEQLSDLEQRFEKGEMDESAYQSTRDELEQALFDDVSVVEQDSGFETTKKSSASKLSSAIIALLVPVIAVGMYLQLGNPDFTQSVSSRQAAKTALQKELPKKADGSPDIDAMVAGLQKKMEANPDNPKGWFMLGRSYMVLKRYPDAVNSYEQALKRMPDSTDVMLSLADSIAMSKGGNIAGRPAELIEKVLKREPDNMTGLWLGGMAARQKHDFVTAIKRWQKVLLQVKGPTEKQELNSLIGEAKKQLTPEQLESVKLASNTSIGAGTSEKTATKSENAAAATSIHVSISLSDDLKKQAQPNDVVFVYAKALSGPPMPLAASKKQVKDLPFDIVLDDSMAMIPSMKLSLFKQVVVGARISKSGQPIPQNGDLFAEKKPVEAGDDVVLVINSLLQK